jgi:hypothetical protein
MSKQNIHFLTVFALFSVTMITPAVNSASTAPDQKLVTISQPVASCQVFVATNGRDSNPGTLSLPFASLEAARDYVRGHKAGATAPMVVCLRGGVYSLAQTFTLGPSDSGTANAPILYRSYPGEQAILSGGVQIHPAWSTYSGEILVADIDQSFNQLFVNGVRATRARTPNADNDGLWQIPAGSVQTPQPSSFPYAPGSLPAGVTSSNIEIVSMERFQSARQRVALTDGQTVTVEGSTDTRNGYGFDYNNTDRYYIENSLSALDSPGEWYLDQSARKLYYWPRSEAEINGEYIVPQLHQLIHAGSYPENAGYDSAESGYIPACQHVGVYPQNPDLLTFAQSSFTVATWLRLPASAVNPWVFSKGNPIGDARLPGNSGFGYALLAQSGANSVQFVVNDGTNGVAASLPPQPAGQWVHVAFVVDRGAGQIRAYANGRFAGSVSVAKLGSIANTIPFDLGEITNKGCSNSAIGDFRIYSSALSASEISEIAAGQSPSPNLVTLWLPFNGDFLDHSPHPSETVAFFPPAFTTGVAGAQAADFSTVFQSDVAGSTDYIGFTDLTFEYADWVIPFTGFPGSTVNWTSPSAVYLHSQFATVEGNSFLHLGSYALGGMMAHSTVAGNQFSDLGGGAIRIGQNDTLQADQSTLAAFASNDVISGNQIQNVGIVDRDAFALFVTRGTNTGITQNSVTNAPFVGISISSGPGGVSYLAAGNDRIEFNQVSNVMQLLNDGAAIYVNGNQPGTSIDHNIIHDVLETPAQITGIKIWGIYLDGGSQNILVRDNLTYRVEAGGIMLNASNDGQNQVKNNIFVDGAENQLTLYYAAADTFENNIVYDGRSAPTQWFFVMASNAIGVSDNNLFYGPNVPDFADQLRCWMHYGFDQDSIVADPLFASYALDDFTLLPSSPALKTVGSGGIGFQPIDFTGVAK